MEIKQEYVLGFAFRSIFTDYPKCNYETQVLLIEKNRGHASLIGKLNGLGGKIEPNESKEEAMIREFAEECGIFTTKEQWKSIFSFKTIYEHIIHIYSIWLEPNQEAIQMESERINWWKVETVLDNIYLKDNCKWIIPMCLDKEIRQGIIKIIENN